MALKQLVDVGEKFPTLKRARLGAAPPIEDVLDNVGAPELAPPPTQAAATAQPEQLKEPTADDAIRAKPATRKKESTTKRVGQGVHKGAGTDARRYRKSGRTFQFGARVKPEFAEGMKVTAADKNVTIGELLEDMRAIYDSINAISTDKKIAVSDLLSEFAKRT
ncbi:MAG: hypothetical protein ABL901_08605 [Hyphomicrobiaceae bacterium]